jgi:hypothetical protein
VQWVANSQCLNRWDEPIYELLVGLTDHNESAA